MNAHVQQPQGEAHGVLSVWKHWIGETELTFPVSGNTYDLDKLEFDRVRRTHDGKRCVVFLEREQSEYDRAHGHVCVPDTIIWPDKSLMVEVYRLFRPSL